MHAAVPVKTNKGETGSVGERLASTSKAAEFTQGELAAGRLKRKVESRT